MRDTFELTADLAQIASALAWLEAIGERDDWPPRLRFGMELSLDEVLTNIVSYAYPEPPALPGRIRLGLATSSDQIALTILDDGRAFDPTAIAPPAAVDSLEDADIGGHGMQLVRHYLDDVQYAHEAGHNRLTLIAAIPRAA